MRVLALCAAFIIPSFVLAQAQEQSPADLWKARGVEAQSKIEKLRKALVEATIPSERRLRELQLLVEEAYALQVTNPQLAHGGDGQKEVFNMAFRNEGDRSHPFLISFCYKDGRFDVLLLSNLPQGWRVSIKGRKDDDRIVLFYLEDRSIIAFDVDDPLNAHVQAHP